MNIVVQAARELAPDRTDCEEAAVRALDTFCLPSISITSDVTGFVQCRRFLSAVAHSANNNTNNNTNNTNNNTNNNRNTTTNNNYNNNTNDNTTNNRSNTLPRYLSRHQVDLDTRDFNMAARPHDPNSVFNPAPEKVEGRRWCWEEGSLLAPRCAWLCA